VIDPLAEFVSEAMTALREVRDTEDVERAKVLLTRVRDIVEVGLEVLYDLQTPPAGKRKFLFEETKEQR